MRFPDRVIYSIEARLMVCGSLLLAIVVICIKTGLVHL